MESGILEQPPTKKHTNGNAKDRISELPDSVLHHILSFLKTKDTVQTSILSKRWTHLWASVPALDFTDESFIKNGDLHFRGSHKYKFENFVDTVLLLRDASDLRSFSLHLYDYFDRGHLHRWIHHATKYNCKVLQITLPWGYKHCRLPMSILPWQSLEELSTSNGAIFGPSKTMVRLRRLQIQVAHLKRGLMENLISSCPVLEDLCLDNCELDALCISSNTLKRLSIKHCKIGGNENLISIPGLVCMTYTDSWGCCTTLRNLSSLLNATVHTSGHDAIELIRAVANVETLNFSCLENYQCKLPEDLSQLLTFDNLRSLTLVGKCTSDMIQVVAFFLQRSPNLKTFTLNTRQVSLQSLSRWKVVVPELVEALLHLPPHPFRRDPVF